MNWFESMRALVLILVLLSGSALLLAVAAFVGMIVLWARSWRFDRFDRDD